jgi:hypothetical protein
VNEREELTHLRRLAAELTARGFSAEIVSGPCLRATNPDVREFSERVVCQRGADGEWAFRWSWEHPIGLVDDPGAAADRITAVLRSVDPGS